MWRVQEGLPAAGAHPLHPAQGPQLLQVFHLSYTNRRSQNPGKRFDQISVIDLVSFLNNWGLAFTIKKPQFRREEKGGKAEQQEEDDEGDVRSSKDRSYASLGSPSVSGSGQVGNQHEYFGIKHPLCSSIKILRSARIKRLAALRRRWKRAALKARSSLRST